MGGGGGDGGETDCNAWESKGDGVEVPVRQDRVQVVTQSVNGAGGLGKTHTVIECLHRSRDISSCAIRF